MMVELQLAKLEPWKMLTAEIVLYLIMKKEIRMHNEQDIVGGDNFD